MSRKLSEQEGHARDCPAKNAKSALFLVVSFSVFAFLGWKGLQKPLALPSLFELIFVVVLAAATLVTWLVRFTCFRERLLLVLFIASLVIGQVARFLPSSVFSSHAETVKSGKLVLSLLGLIVSLSMLVQPVANPHSRPEG
jgi:prepilin signal peptidase PulO-like enzyme (type II secretory pathway)